MLLLLCLAVLAGVVLPVQAGINAQMRLHVGNPIVAALISFAVGTAALLGLVLTLRAPLPSGGALGRMPGWQWLGGVLGAGYIAVTIVVAPRLGAATLVAAIVAGQMGTSLLLDQYGWVGYPPQPVTAARLLGALLVVAGVLLIQRR